MSTDKLFTCAGVSESKGTYKVRFASDITRVKVLAKTGNSDIAMVELPNAMTKSQAVNFLKSTALYDKNQYREAIDRSLCTDDVVIKVNKSGKLLKPDKSLGSPLVTQKRGKKIGPSIEQIRARITDKQSSEVPADILEKAFSSMVSEIQKNSVSE